MATSFQPLTANQVRDTASGLVKDVTRALDRAQQYKDWLAGFTDTDLLNNWGISASDAADLRSAYLDLEQIRAIFLGLQPLAAAKDFRTFTKRLVAFGSNF